MGAKLIPLVQLVRLVKLSEVKMSGVVSSTPLAGDSVAKHMDADRSRPKSIDTWFGGPREEVRLGVERGNLGVRGERLDRVFKK